MINQKWMGIIRKIWLYLFSLFLFTEWMRPVSELTDIGSTYGFLLFIVFSLILHFFSVHWLLRLVLLVSYIVVFIQIIYFDVPFWTFTWMNDYVSEFMLNAYYVWGQDWFLLTDSFRTLLLFVMLWLVTYIIHYWVNVKSNMFSFFFITILFFAILDTFTPYDAKNSIIRVTVLGLMTMGLVAFFRLVLLEKISSPSKLLSKWLIPLVCMLVFSTGIGLVAPKFNPQWPDPVPYVQSFSQHTVEGGASINKVGYDEDDTKLGGTIRSDSSVVFYNTANISHYWKVESKDVYTGKGWVSYYGDSLTFPNGEEWTDFENDAAPQLTTKEFEANVSVIEDNHHILYPAGSILKEVDADGVKAFRYDTSILKITPVTDLQSVKRYTILYEQPRYDIAELRKINAPDAKMDELMTQNTQLPDKVPDRVRKLAIELTEKQANLYDKVKAVENYLGRPEFVYSKENIQYPSKNQDYVDQFLFETKIGYCDNFSTSMVVLLRAAGIPARWTKGYTEGEHTIYQGESVNKVTNNNAHSWVEVYFLGIGWVSFEPTKGFSGNTDFFNSVANVGGKSESTAPVKKLELEQKIKKQEKIMENERKMTKDHMNVVFPLIWLGIGLMVLVVVVLSLYWTRKKWLPLLLIAHYKRKQSSLVEAYEVLIKQLQRVGLKRDEGQTLRDYAASIDSVYKTNKMTELTNFYERIIYRGDLEGDAWTEYRASWEYLMKKTSS